MLDFNAGVSLDSFLEKGEAGERARIDVAFSGAAFSERFEQEVADLPERRIVAFLELFCPDAAALIPYLARICELNDRFDLRCYPVKGNEPMLMERTGVAKIPTLLVFDAEGHETGTYVEHPVALRENLAVLEGKAKRDLLRDFREGRCGELIEDELLRVLRRV